MRSRSRSTLARAAALALSLPFSATAQSPDSTKLAVPLSAVTVTATRTERTTFNTPQPITVLDSLALRERLAHGVADLFREQTGLDASGVGPNQRRPEIRGLRGQRILLLQDGLRLNNARRQQDFGELPTLAGISGVERVEVVRGPSSVLYGTDAIGGVVNLFSDGLPRALPSGAVRGEMSFRYGDAGSAKTPSGTVVARFGRATFRATAAYREADDYRAPAGSFGNITLDDDVVVHDSRVRDRSYRLLGGYELSTTSELFARADLYSAEHAGFGFIDPALLGPTQPTIRIRYPDQDYHRYTLGWRAAALTTPFANRVEVSAYTQENERNLAMNIFVPISPTANVRTDAYNFTDLETAGGRLELAKSLGSHVLTYGVDVFRDRSDNTDSSMTVVTGFGPPSSQSSNVPTVPNATFQSAGVFAQLELNPVDRFTTTLGARYQDVVAETKATPGVTNPLVKSSDRAVAWAANALYRLVPDLNAVVSVGRGFRAPNLVERFFEGEAPEGNGFQQRNPDLDPETSLNVDVGLRFRRGPWFAESFVFRNDIKDAIAAVETGAVRNRQPVFQSRNVGHLRIDGLEVTAGARATSGIDASLGFTRLIGSNISDPDSPIGDTYASKIVGDLGYRHPGGRFTVGYTVRRQGEQKDVIIGNNPIGPVIPSFVVHSARASLRVLDRPGLSQQLLFKIDNIGDRLYAEFPNASFFRPEPGRTISLGLIVGF